MSDTTESLGATTGDGGELAEFHYPPYSRLEIWKPPTDGLHGYLDVEIVDFQGIEPRNIIKEKHDWKVCCNLWLYGDIWKCVCGELCCEVCFKPCHPDENGKTHYSLAELTGETLCHDFEGCCGFIPGEHGKPGHVHRRFCATVPAGSLPAGEDGKPRVYEWTATLSFKNPCGDYGVIAGFETGHLQVYKSS